MPYKSVRWRICTFAKIRKAVWPYIRGIKQQHGSDLDEFKVEDMAQREAAANINRILKRVHISQEIYWSAIDMSNSIRKRAHELVSNGFLFSDRGLELLCGPRIWLRGKLLSHEITPFIISLGSQKEDEQKLSLSTRTFCESLRQQLSQCRGKERIKIVCPLAYKGQACCGKKDLLQRLQKRLPEIGRSNFDVRNCDDIRAG